MKRNLSLFLTVILLVFALFPMNTPRAISAQDLSDGSEHSQDENSADIIPDGTADIGFAEELFPYGLKGAPKYDLNDDFSMIKVLITIGNVKKVTLNLHGGYYIENNLRSIAADADKNSSIKISVSSGQVAVSQGNTVLYKGNSVVINRVILNSYAGWAQLITAGNDQNNGNKYLGNFKFSVNDGFLEMINIVPTAHYLYGIVPYEMSESNEPEALIAQAITSKSYAFAFPNYPNEEYVITDSFNYQGYRGYKPGYTKTMKACTKACGKILSYNDELFLTFYAAANGGETDLPSHIFGPGSLDDAYEIKLDDPDFRYAENKRQTLEITYGEPPENSKFASLLNGQIQSALGHKAQIKSITGCSLHTPKHEGSLRNLTMMDVTMKVLDGGTERTLTVSFKTKLLKDKGVFTKNYKIYWGEPTAEGYNVYFCRWGHGLGLSQYGAQARALRGECSKAILTFYFNKFDLSRVKENNPEDPFSYTQPVAAYGVVIKTNSTVNLRTQPTTNSDVAARIAVNTHLDIISENNGWITCIADGMFGYIRGDYVSVVLFPAPEGAQANYGTGATNTKTVLYASPSAYSSKITTVEKNTSLTAKAEIGSWYYVDINGLRGFIPKSDVFVISWDIVDLHTILTPRP